MIKQLRDTLLTHSKKQTDIVGTILDHQLQQWQDKTSQTDDMMMIGFEIGEHLKITLNQTIERLA